MSTRLQALCEQLKLMTPATEFANLADQLAAKGAITVDWGRAAKEWREAINQFAIACGDRFTRAGS